MLGVPQEAEVVYHRRGNGYSKRPEGPVSIAEQAQDCRELLRHLQIESAHVVGYSFGGAIALQLALDSAGTVRSLSLLEPILPGAITSPVALQYFMGIMGRAVGQYAAGDKAGAIDAFAKGAFGPDYRGLLDRALPGAFEQAIADADTMFQVEVPALQGWTFTSDDARQILVGVAAIVADDLERGVRMRTGDAAECANQIRNAPPVEDR